MKEHNYYGPHRGWGHDYSIMQVIDNGKQLKLAGWGRGIKAGDIVYLDNNENPDRKAKYKIVSIEYELDPPDMWFADASWIQRHFDSVTLKEIECLEK